MENVRMGTHEPLPFPGNGDGLSIKGRSVPYASLLLDDFTDRLEHLKETNRLSWRALAKSITRLLNDNGPG